MTLLWCTWLIGVAVVLQTLEYFRLPVWDWEIQRDELPFVFQPYRTALVFRGVAALSLFWLPTGTAFVILLATTWLIAVRWRGTFNGGSDAMTMQVLLALTLAWFFPRWSDAALWYICVQAVLSYFVAGVSKLRSREWREGKALAIFLQREPRPSDRILSWLVILFECGFPLALLRPELSLVFLGGGLLFHLLIAYQLQLNRFFWAWLATYPAVYWASLHFATP